MPKFLSELDRKSGWSRRALLAAGGAAAGSLLLPRNARAVLRLDVRKARRSRSRSRSPNFSAARAEAPTSGAS
jgi:hypothetical protein